MDQHLQSMFEARDEILKEERLVNRAMLAIAVVFGLLATLGLLGGW